MTIDNPEQQFFKIVHNCETNEITMIEISEEQLNNL